MFWRLFSYCLCLPATVSELCVSFLGKILYHWNKKQKKSNKNFYGHLEVVGFLALSNAEPHADDTQKEFIYFMNPSAKVISLFSLKTKNNVVDMATLFLILLFNFFPFFRLLFFLFILLLLFFCFIIFGRIKAKTRSRFSKYACGMKVFQSGETIFTEKLNNKNTP